MIVGIPREIKTNENRVAITPAGVSALVKAGHRVIIEAGAGTESGLPDQDYADADAPVILDAKEVWAQSEMIMKVKEAIAVEYDRFRPGLILFTFLHLAAEPELAGL
jgi:alanine dehydrogenase